MDKQPVVYSYNTVLFREKKVRYQASEKTQRKVKCILLSKEVCLRKLNTVILTSWHSRKATLDRKSVSGCQRLREEGGKKG